MQVHKTDFSFYCVKSVHTVQYVHVYQMVWTLSVTVWHTCTHVYSTENIQKVITYAYSYRQRYHLIMQNQLYFGTIMIYDS